MGNEQPTARNANNNQDNYGNNKNVFQEVESQSVWTCPTCTFENKIKHDTGQMCFNGDRPHTLSDKILLKQVGFDKKRKEREEVKRKAKDEDEYVTIKLRKSEWNESFSAMKNLMNFAQKEKEKEENLFNILDSIDILNKHIFSIEFEPKTNLNRNTHKKKNKNKNKNNSALKKQFCKNFHGIGKRCTILHHYHQL